MAKIRFADPGDAGYLAKMNSLFNHQLIDARLVRRKLQRGAEIVLVAEFDGHPGGFACAQFFDSFCYPSPYAELTELYIEARHRRKGAAVALVKRMEAELARRGVTHIHILTGVRNKPARALYERLGYSHSRKRPEMLYDKNMRPRSRPSLRSPG